MSQQSVTASLKSNLQRLTSHNLKSNANTFHVQSSIIGKPLVVGEGAPELTPKEEQTVHEAVMKGLVDGRKILRHLSKASILVENHEGQPDFMEHHSDVVMTIYEGRGAPPVTLKDLDYSNLAATILTPEDQQDETSSDDSALEPTLTSLIDFKQSGLAVGHKSLMRWRWYKIHISKDCSASQNQWSSTLHRIHENIQGHSQCVRLYHLPVKATSRLLDLGEAFELFSDPGGSHESEIASSMSLEQLFRILIGEAKDTMATNLAPNLHSLESRVGKINLPGLDVVTDKRIDVRTGPGNLLAFSEKLHTDVHISADSDTSLADFVWQHCRNLAGRLQSSEGVEILTTMLKGVKVYVRTGHGKRQCQIARIKSGSTSDVPYGEQFLPSQTWPNPSLSSALPCVNLGTLEEPLYLPMELCQVLPEQRLHGPRDLSLDLHVDHSSKQSSIDLSNPAYHQVESQLVFHARLQKDAASLNQALVDACKGKFPNLLFVEAGSGPIAPRESKEWTKLRIQVEEVLHESFIDYVSSTPRDDVLKSIPEKRGAALPLLSLRYAADADPSSRGTKQLLNFVAACSIQTVIVVWFAAERQCNKMYQIIKKACDLTIGAQTLFVNASTFQNRAYKASGHPNPQNCVNSALGPVDIAVIQTANDLRHRLRSKNPRMLKTVTSSAQQNLVIAMHVSQLASPVPSAQAKKGRPHDSGTYLVVFVSRALDRNEKYHTEIGLFTTSQIRAQDHLKLLDPFFSFFPKESKREITILRSGHSFSHSSDRFETQPDLTDPAVFSTPRTIPPEGLESVSSRWRSHDHKSLDGKTALETAICKLSTGDDLKAISVKVGSKTFTYITLKEDALFESHMSRTEFEHACRNNTTPAMLFIKDTELVNVQAQSVKVQHVHGRQSKSNISSGAITATILHYTASKANKRLASGTQALPKDALKSGTPSRKASAQSLSTARAVSSSPLPERLRTSGSTRDNSPEKDNPPLMTQQHPTVQSQVTENDIAGLVHVWRDDGLELYGTKWPVPTHLAHLATRRAMAYLRTDDWENFDMNPTAPFRIPEVHKDICDSLYYL